MTRSAWGRRWLPVLASGLIRTLRRTLRLTWENDGVVRELHRAGRPYVHAFFHDQLLLMTYSYLGQSYGRTLAVLSSRHRDGEYVSRTLERFGHLMVRGSTGRGGAAALVEMIRHLRAGRDAAFATDGPRGPRHRVQVGVVEAARLGRAPIVPVAFAASRGSRLRSWDRFFVPQPFARGVFVYGDPISVEARADRDTMERIRADLERILEDLTARAEARAAGARAEAIAGLGGKA
ncbi:MAG TPA: lysophospholipid acyltransferase family protein [Candidatus Polarisedimenticolia bacterium]|nr:lysophospholipid acyltransferase family protein [Candidatus Polarisedimenticolia bacterium]